MSPGFRELKLCGRVNTEYDWGVIGILREKKIYLNLSGPESTGRVAIAESGKWKVQTEKGVKGRSGRIGRSSLDQRQLLFFKAKMAHKTVCELSDKQTDTIRMAGYDGNSWLFNRFSVCLPNVAPEC